MKRAISIFLVLVIMFSVIPIAEIIASAAMEVTNVTVEKGYTATFTCVGGYTHISFRGDPIIAQVTGYDSSGAVFYSKRICGKLSEGTAGLFSRAGYVWVVEVYYGSATVGYNIGNPKIEFKENEVDIFPVFETNIENIYLSVGDTAKFDISWAQPGYYAAVNTNYNGYTNLAGVRYRFVNGYGSSDEKCAVVQDGTILAKSVGQVTIGMAAKFGFSENEYITFGAVCTVTVIDDYGLSEAHERYNAQGNDKYFNIVADKDGKRDVGFDITFDDKTMNTEDDYQTICTFPDKYEGSVKFSKDGYIPYVMENKYINSYNWVKLANERTDGAPSILAVLGQKTGSNEWHNLQLRTLNIFEESAETYCIDAEIYSNDNLFKSVWLQQGNVNIPLSNGTTGEVALGQLLKSDGGPVYLKAETYEGLCISTQLMINVFRPDKYAYLDFGDNGGLTAEVEEDVDVFKGMPFSLKLGGNIPFEYSVDENGKFKATIGLLNTHSATATYYDAVKETVHKVDKFTGDSYTTQNAKEVDNLLAKMKKDGIEQLEAQASVGFECKAGFLGYAEGQRDETGALVVTDMGIICTIGMECSLKRQSFAFSVPYYWKVAVGAEMQVPILAQGMNEKGNFVLKTPDLVMEIKFTGSIMMGYMGVVGAGVKLTSSLIISGPKNSSLSETKWVINAKFTMVTEFLNFEYEESWWGDLENHVLYDPKKDKKTVTVNSEVMNSLTDERYYIQTPRTDSSISINTEDVLKNGDSLSETLIPNSYSNSMPQIINKDGKILLIWVGDNESRTVENRTCIYYSVYDPESNQWSETKPVADNGKADYNPILKKIGDKAYLVWQKSSVEYDSGATMSDIASALDIVYAEYNFDTNEFSDFVNVSGENNVYDFSPDVIQIDGNVAVAWAQNDANDIFGVDGEESIYFAMVLEDSIERNEIANNLNSVYGLAIERTEDDIIINYALDVDGDHLTYEDVEIFAISTSTGENNQITENDVLDQLPMVFDEKLYWYSDGIVTDGEIDVNCILDDTKYKMISDGNGTQVVVYTVQNDLENNVFATINDGNGWGEPIQITDFENSYITDFGASVENGVISVVANCKEVVEDGKLSNSSLKFVQKSLGVDLAVEDADYVKYTLVEGGRLEGSATIVNKGGATAHLAVVDIRDADGNTIAQKAVSDCVLPGESIDVSFYCNVDDITSDELTIKVRCNEEDDYIDNNSTVLQISKQDVAVEKSFAESVGNGNVVITTFVANYGMEECNGIQLEFRKNSIDGEIIGTCEISTLDKLSRSFVTYKSDMIDFGDIVYITAINSKAENLTGNNYDFAYVTSPVQCTIEQVGDSTDESIEEYNGILGDINKNGMIDSMDYLYLKRAYFKQYVLDDIRVGDINKNGVIDSMDYLYLKRAYFKQYVLA